ncbi:ExbD/TolR family protein [Chamaesiphon sp.]|uniref:ExbD/TolR family protein n=1 Tax=Chamaesiphon sp. TaxID=2814140 RepID=UPI003593303B
MQFLNEPEDRPPEVNVVPLIDVIFAILTFFIMASLTLSKTEGLAVNLPGASSGKAQDRTKVVITIDDKGAVSLNRQSVNLSNLTPQIKALLAKDEQALVVINADEKIGHGQVVEVMDLVRQIPGVKMGIATKRKQ